MIIDAQVHLWEAERPDRPWADWARDAPMVHRRNDPLEASEILATMDAAGVDMAVLVPPSWIGDRNEAVQEAVIAHPDRLLAFGRLPLDRRLTPRELAETLAGSHLTGFRLTFNQPALCAQLVAGDVDWLWAGCQELDIPVMLYAPGMPEELAAVARRFPELRIAIDHLNLAGVHRDAAALLNAARALEPAAALPNIRIKVSALPTYLAEGIPLHDLEPIVNWAVDRFDADRTFWGSDMSRLRCSYREWLDVVRLGCPDLTPAERALLLGDAMARWLKLTAPAGSEIGERGARP